MDEKTAFLIWLYEKEVEACDDLIAMAEISYIRLKYMEHFGLNASLSSYFEKLKD